MPYIYARKIESGRMTLEEFKSMNFPPELTAEVLEILERHGYLPRTEE